MNTQTYSEQEWQTLHEEMQTCFHALAAEVNRLAPSAQPEYGKTVTKRFPLFSHVSFNLVPDGARSDIIVGVDIGLEDGQWRIDADIVDEVDGTIYFELPNTPFPAASFDELRQRAMATTDELIARGRPVLLRLFGSAGPLLPNQSAMMPNLAPKP